MVCHEIKVPKEVCMIQFKRDKYHHSLNKNFITNRGELMIIYVNKKNEVMGIELLADFKPCQDEKKDI